MLGAKIILVVMTSITAGLGNSMLKAGASGGEVERLQARQLSRILFKPVVLAGVALYALSQLLWITFLRIADLSLAYPLMIGLNFTLIMSIAWAYFKEPISPGKLMGAGLIFAGILTITSG